MIWDCLIGWVVVLFTLLGWSAGILRSWTVPISMLVATFLAQHIYVDLAALLVETLHLESTFAVFTGYYFCWLFIVQYCELLLSNIQRPQSAQSAQPAVLSKLGGGILGFTKGLAAFVLAAMVAFAHRLPEPPEIAWQNQWILSAAKDSLILPRLHLIAAKLDEPLGKYVLSDSAPRFKMNFALGDDPFDKVKKQEEERGKNFVKGWKKFKEDLGSVDF